MCKTITKMHEYVMRIGKAEQDRREYYFATHASPVLPIARGEYLDNLGKLLGLVRDKEENDYAYRKRLSIAFATGG